MATIVHITADYPDAFERAKTPAVANLLALVPEHRHVVYSLNRRDGFAAASIVDRQPDLTTVVYRAPPYGILLRRGLQPVTELIATDMAAQGLRPDVVHAHKLTIDGLVAGKLAAAVGCPLICSIWGNTDQKVIAAKPLLRSAFRSLAREASMLLPATPWVADYAVSSLGVDRRKLRLLPVVCHLAPPRSSAEAPGRVVTLLNLDAYRGKNIPALITAIAQLRRAGTAVTLDIYGGGSAESRQALARHIAHAGADDFVSLRGRLAHDRVPEVLSRYAAFAMPSRRETFGMVYIEALFAGLPILYPRGQAIDGFFDDVDIGRKCDATSVRDIAEALSDILAREPALKRQIAHLHEQGWFHRFEEAAIAEQYRGVIGEAMAGAKRAERLEA